MAVILLEDFNDLAAWTNVSAGTTLVAGRTGQSLQITGTTPSLRYAIPTPAQADTITMGFAFNVASRTNRQSLVQFCSDAGATVHTDLSVTVNGALELAIGGAGGGTVSLTTNNLVNAGTWYYVEIQVKLSDTVGTVIITLNGSQRINQTAKDTKSGGTKTVYDQIRLPTPNATSGGTVLFDDLYIGMGALPFLGDKAYAIKDLAGSSAGVSTTPTTDMVVKGRVVHAIICVYLGDVELDIGKTARWLQNFCDTIFFFDATPGTISRQWAIDYAKSWPTAQFAAYPNTSPSYFVQPEAMRQAAFTAAQAAWNYDPNDWVFFCDASESVSVDVPVDQLALHGNSITFRYLYDEVAVATGTEVTVPVRIFLTQGAVTEKDTVIDLALSIRTNDRIAYIEDKLANDVLTDEDRAAYEAELDSLQIIKTANETIFWSVDPHYLALTGGLTNCVRLVKVSHLTSGFDFKKIDTYGASGQSAAVHTALVSYAYARFSEKDYHDPSLWVRENDEGYTSRQYIQQVPGRHLLGLPTTDAEYGNADPAGQGLISMIPIGPAQINASFTTLLTGRPSTSRASSPTPPVRKPTTGTGATAAPTVPKPT